MLSILLLFLIPLVSGLALMFLKDLTSAKIIAFGAATLSVLVALYALISFKADGSEQFVSKFEWIPALNISFYLGLDGISLILVLLTVVLFLVIVSSSLRLSYASSPAFFGLLLLAEAALIGVFSAKDIFLFYFFFEATLLPVYFLASYWGGIKTGKHAFRMFIYTLFGSLFLLITLVYLYTKAGGASFTEIYRLKLSDTEQYWIFAALILAFGIKAPMFPLHGWQPDIYAEAPTPATMILTGLMSKMGIYGIIRFVLPLLPIAIKNLGLFVAVLAVIGLLYGAIVAMKQRSFKRILAYSSLSHMGLMIAALMFGNAEAVQGTMAQMVAHGINAVGLFYVAKLIYDRTATRDIYELGGIAQFNPVFTVCFIVLVLGSVALPLTNGFPGEFLLLQQVFNLNHWLGALAGISIILGAVYMLRATQFTLFGDATPNTASFKPLTSIEVTILIGLALAVIYFGLMPNRIFSLTEPSVNKLFISNY